MPDKKNEGLAAVLSFLFSGLGQIYVGRIGRGIAIIVGTVLIAIFGSVLLEVPLVIYWIWNIYDAYNLAKKHNQELMRTSKVEEATRPQRVGTTLPPQGIQTTPMKSYAARCEACGNPINEGDNFCQACGTPTAKGVQPNSATRTLPPEAPPILSRTN